MSFVATSARGRSTDLRGVDAARCAEGARSHRVFLADQGAVNGAGGIDIGLGVHAIDPVIAVLLGFCAFVAALSLQFWVRRYIAWTYWLAVCAVGVFGTMCADVLHVRFGVAYGVSTVLYAVVLAAVFFAWDRTERTLSFHEIDTVRREIFYWAAVVATFAMGTALGDLTATTFGLGYFGSMIVFAGVIAVPAIGYRRLKWNSIFCFWFRLRGDTAAWRLVRGLAGKAVGRSRPRPRQWPRGTRAGADDLRIGGLPRGHAPRRTERREHEHPTEPVDASRRVAA